MQVFEVVIALLLGGAALARHCTSRWRAVSRARSAGRRRARAHPRHADAGARSGACARALRRARAGRRRIRCISPGHARELAPHRESRPRRRCAHHRRRRGRRAPSRSGDAVGGGHRARRHRCAAGRRCRHYRVEAAPAAESAARHSRGREPLQRCERAPRLPARCRRDDDRVHIGMECASDARWWSRSEASCSRWCCRDCRSW